MSNKYTMTEFRMNMKELLETAEKKIIYIKKHNKNTHVIMGEKKYDNIKKTILECKKLLKGEK